MKITPQTKLCVVIGDPVEDSLSPQIHNAGYVSLGLDGQFVYVAARVPAEALGAFVGGARAMGLRGFACKMPHKLAVMAHLDDIDEVAQAIGAVNTVVNDNGRLIGYNTDWLGIITPLETIAPLRGKRVALLGAGGAARAAAYGVTAKGAELVIYNRTLEKARQLADQFGAAARSFDDLAEVRDMDIVINATAVGLPIADQATPLPKEFISDRQIIFDVVYAARETRLLTEARQQGARVIPGTEMLLYQGMSQFKLFTGHEAPEMAMREAFQAALNSSEAK